MARASEVSPADGMADGVFCAGEKSKVFGFEAGRAFGAPPEEVARQEEQ